MSYGEWLAALAIWREARGQSLQAMHAIWWVIQNRVMDKRWPNTVSGVVRQRLQFSSMTASGDPNLLVYPEEPANGAAPAPDWVAFLNAQVAITTDLGGDPTHGANHYHSMPIGKEPHWADPAKMTVAIGPFRFYCL
jgi:cell wall hydrolase